MNIFISNKKAARFALIMSLIIFIYFASCSKNSSINLMDQNDSKEIENFNFVVGTQTIGASYQFTNFDVLIETANGIREMGSNILKIALKNDNMSLTDLVSKNSTYRSLLEMDFTYYLFWAYGAGDWVRSWRDNNFSSQDSLVEYNAIYDLTKYLLNSYQNTGKEFYIGHWEGDWDLVNFDGNLWNENVTIPPQRIKAMTRWFNVRQKAVDDAKNSGSYSGVEVYHYVEVNLVKKARRGGVCITNDILPNVNVDYVSYSSYDITAYIKSYSQMKAALFPALDYIESKLQVKSAIEGKRVWIGEYGYPVGRGYTFDPQTPEEQDLMSRNVMKVGIEWGCPFVLYWEFYNNEADGDKQNGFWMINNAGEKQPIYFTHQNFYKRAKSYIDSFRASNGRVPSAEEFKEVAPKWLE